MISFNSLSLSFFYFFVLNDNRFYVMVSHDLFTKHCFFIGEVGITTPEFQSFKDDGFCPP